MRPELKTLVTEIQKLSQDPPGAPFTWTEAAEAATKATLDGLANIPLHDDADLDIAPKQALLEALVMSLSVEFLQEVCKGRKPEDTPALVAVFLDNMMATITSALPVSMEPVQVTAAE